MKNSHDAIGNLTRDLPSCSAIFARVAAHIFRIEKQISCFQYIFLEIVKERDSVPSFSNKYIERFFKTIRRHLQWVSRINAHVGSRFTKLSRRCNTYHYFSVYFQFNYYQLFSSSFTGSFRIPVKPPRERLNDERVECGKHLLVYAVIKIILISTNKVMILPKEHLISPEDVTTVESG